MPTTDAKAEPAPAAPPAPVTPLDKLKNDLSAKQTDSAKSDLSAAASKAYIAILLAAVQEVQKNIDQFTKEWQDLRAQANEDRAKYQQQTDAAVSALGGSDSAKKFEDEWIVFTVKQINTPKDNVKKDQDKISAPGSLAAQLADAQQKRADAQSDYDGLKVASIKANLQQLEKLFDDANKLSLLAGTAGGVYYLLKGLGLPLKNNTDTALLDPSDYQDLLVEAAEDLAKAVETERTAQGLLDQANKDLTADQKTLAAHQASLKQDVLDHLKSFTPSPAKPIPQKPC